MRAAGPESQAAKPLDLDDFLLATGATAIMRSFGASRGLMGMSGLSSEQVFLAAATQLIARWFAR